MKSPNHSERSRIAVLYVITRLAVGGAPRILLSTVCALDRSKYKVVLVTGNPERGEGSFIDTADSLGIEIVLLPDLRREVHPIRDLKVFWQLFSFIRSGRYQIVHTHLSKAGILGRLAAWCANVPVIVHTFHGDVFTDYFNPVLGKLFLVVERIVARLTTRFAVVSEDLKSRLNGYRIAKKQLFVVIPNGIQRGNSSATKAQEEPVTLRVGTVAMFYPIKRVDLFIRMADRVRDRFSQVEFAVAGGGQDDASLRTLSSELGEPVQFQGICYDIPEFLSTLDIFVLCSDYESAGVAMMEAMMAGLPTVATRVGGIPEALSEGETGILVPKGDLAALSDAVVVLLADRELRQKMGKSASEYAEKYLSTDKMVKKLQSLYESLVD